MERWNKNSVYLVQKALKSMSLFHNIHFPCNFEDPVLDWISIFYIKMKVIFKFCFVQNYEIHLQHSAAVTEQSK